MSKKKIKREWVFYRDDIEMVRWSPWILVAINLCVYTFGFLIGYVVS